LIRRVDLVARPSGADPAATIDSSDYRRKFNLVLSAGLQTGAAG
jgi:hypothetical protein